MPFPSSVLSSAPRDLDLRLERGVWPDDISGEMFIAGPDPRTDMPYILFGDGVLYRLSLRPGSFGAPADRWAWRARPVDTPSAVLRRAQPGLFPTDAPANLIGRIGAVNSANTATLPWGDRLFLTWEAGRPVEVDPYTLDVLGEVGARDQWQAPFGDTFLFPFVFSSSHPVVDVDRNCVWTVQLVPASSADGFAFAVWVVRYDGTGTQLDAWPLDGVTLPGSVHTISQTPEWLIIADSGNFKVDVGEVAGGERTVLTDLDEAVLFVRKDHLCATRPGQPVPAQQVRVGPPVGHYYAVDDDTDGTVRILFEHMENMDLGYFLRPDDQDAFGRPVDPNLVGAYNMSLSPAVLTEFTIDVARGRVVDQVRVSGDEHLWNTQLNAMDWSREAMRAPTLHHIVFHGFKPGNIAKRALDNYAAAGRIDPAALPSEELAPVLASFARGSLKRTSEYTYPLDELPTSPIFVPRDPDAAGTSRFAGSEPGGHDGYVVVPVLSDSAFRVDVFDAADVGAGPVARLRAAAGETVPVMLHAAWTPRAVPADRSLRRVGVREDLPERLLGRLDADEAGRVRELAARLDAVAAGDDSTPAGDLT